MGDARRPDLVAGLLDTQPKHDFIGYLIGLLISMGIGLAVMLAEIAVQSGRMLDHSGLAWSISILFGPTLPGDLSAAQAWNAITGQPGLVDPDGYRRLLELHLVLDHVFIATYFLTALLLIFKVCRPVGQIAGIAALVVVAISDLVENGMARAVMGGETGKISDLALATDIKWGAALVLLVIVILSLATQGPANPSTINRASVRTAWQAVMTQRLSLLPTIALLVLSVTAGAPILEQLPDVQRGWIDDGLWNAQALAALAAMAVLAVSILVTTRLRTAYVERVTERPWTRAPEARLEYWLLGPAVAVTAFLFAFGPGRASISAFDQVLRDGSDTTVYLLRLMVFLGVPIGIYVVSRILRLRWQRRPSRYRPWHAPSFTDSDVAAVRFVGNVSTIAVIVVGGLGLIRAFSPVIILREQQQATPSLDLLDQELQVGAELVSRSWVWVIVGVTSVVVPWLVLAVGALRASRRLKADERRAEARRDKGVTDRHAAVPPLAKRGLPSDDAATSGSQRRRPGDPDPSARRAGLVLFVVWVAIFTGFGVAPTLAGEVGLAATAVLGIGALTGMVSSVALLMQGHMPAEIFRLFHLSRSPYVTVLVLTLVMVGLASGQGTIHEVDLGRRESSLRNRTDLSTAFDQWYADTDGCRIAVGDRHVRPMLLIAAEGGGIRAAYWTVRSLEALGLGTCAGRAALFSTGSSGGSVGLTVARFSGTKADPGITRAVDAVDQMADDSILAAGADGMFVRDTFYGATGVPVPRWVGSTDTWAWADRARLIEEGWARAYDPAGPAWGTRSFLGEQDLSPVTGHLILNSTSAKSNCRVWVSQLALPATSSIRTEDTFDPEYNCDKARGPGPRTIDLFGTYGPFTGSSTDAEATKKCFADVQAATAALLTARFPYVTPGGVVGPCPIVEETEQAGQPYWPSTQLVDGGYLEDSGLATITDLAPEWLPMVGDRNLKAVAEGGDLVVPIVVFLANGDPKTTRPKTNENPTSEVSLPLRTYLRGGRSLSGPDALLERAQAVVALEGFCPTRTSNKKLTRSCSLLDNAFDRRVVVVDRLPTPEVSAPLGWALSRSTRTTLNLAIDDQLRADCRSGRPTPSCALGYAPLGQLRRYFGASPP